LLKREGKMVLKRVVSILVLISFVTFLFSCAGERKRTKTGAAIGTVTGAGIGYAIGKQSGHGAEGAAVGAVMGALIGGGIGYYLDKQEEELRRIKELEVKRERDRLIATLSNSLLFDFDSAVVRPEAYQTLKEVAGVLNRYPETKIIVKGYTDSTGSEDYNQKLSEKRANSVKNVLIGEHVDPSRITAIGFGEQFPVASNDTEWGRQKNRRVELEIIPTEPVKG